MMSDAALPSTFIRMSGKLYSCAGAEFIPAGHSGAIMLIEQKKENSVLRLAITTVCVLCLVGLSVFTTYAFMNKRYTKQIHILNQKIMLDKRNIKNLSDINSELKMSIATAENQYMNTKSLNKVLSSMLHSTEHEDTNANVKLKELLKNLNEAKTDALKRELELTTKLQTLQNLLAPYIIVKPTWIMSGQSTPIIDDTLTATLNPIPPDDKAHTTFVAFVSLIQGKLKRKLFLEAGKPQPFYYKGKKYLFNVLQSNSDKGGVHYCISILKAW
ncbi:MAG: hypothetical protein ACP5SH_17060 [Syntrophobacteraceae bacterium]